MEANTSKRESVDSTGNGICRSLIRRSLPVGDLRLVKRVVPETNLVNCKNTQVELTPPQLSLVLVDRSRACGGAASRPPESPTALGLLVRLSSLSLFWPSSSAESRFAMAGNRLVACVGT